MGGWGVGRDTGKKRDRTYVLRHFEKYSNKYQNCFTHLAAQHTKKMTYSIFFRRTNTVPLETKSREVNKIDLKKTKSSDFKLMQLLIKAFVYSATLPEIHAVK